MAVDANNLLVAGNLHVFVAPTATPGPTDIDGALNVAFVDVGYTTRDGTTLKPSNPKDPIYGHQSALPIRYVPGDQDFTVNTQMMEWNEHSLALWLGGATVTPDGGGFKLTAPDPSVVDTRSWVFEAVDGDHLARLYIPSGLVLDSGETQWQPKAAGLLPITIGTTQLDEDVDPYTLWIDFSLT